MGDDWWGRQGLTAVHAGLVLHTRQTRQTAVQEGCKAMRVGLGVGMRAHQATHQLCPSLHTQIQLSDERHVDPHQNFTSMRTNTCVISTSHPHLQLVLLTSPLGLSTAINSQTNSTSTPIRSPLLSTHPVTIPDTCPLSTSPS